MTIDDNQWQSLTVDDNRWQVMIIDDNRWQLKNTNFLAIDWSSISDINRLIVIDWYLLLSIVIDYRFHLLIMPGYFLPKFSYAVINMAKVYFKMLGLFAV